MKFLAYLIVLVILLIDHDEILSSYLNLYDYGYNDTNSFIPNVNLKNKNLTKLTESTFDNFSIIILELDSNQIELVSNKTFTNIKYLFKQQPS
jgi:hypothetical protein